LFIPDPDPDCSPIPGIPGSKRHRIPDPQHRPNLLILLTRELFKKEREERKYPGQRSDTKRHRIPDAQHCPRKLLILFTRDLYKKEREERK
jgi:hypothetical protein